MKSNLWFWNITRAISLMNRAWNWRDNEDKFVSIIYCIIKFFVLLSKFPPNAPDWSIPYFMAIYYSMEAHLVPPRIFLSFHWCHTQVVPLAGGLPDVHTRGKVCASPWTSPGTVVQTQKMQSLFSCGDPKTSFPGGLGRASSSCVSAHLASPPLHPTPIYWSKSLISFKTWRWTLLWGNCLRIWDPAFNTDTEWGRDSHIYPKCQEFCRKLGLNSSINGCQSRREGWMALFKNRPKCQQPTLNLKLGLDSGSRREGVPKHINNSLVKFGKFRCKKYLRIWAWSFQVLVSSLWTTANHSEKKESRGRLRTFGKTMTIMDLYREDTSVHWTLSISWVKVKMPPKCYAFNVATAYYGHKVAVDSLLDFCENTSVTQTALEANTS